MGFAAIAGVVTGGVLGALLAWELALDGFHRRMTLRPHPQAKATIGCGRCGKSGTLSVQTTSSNEESSTDLVMYCARCGSGDWQVLKPADRP